MWMHFEMTLFGVGDLCCWQHGQEEDIEGLLPHVPLGGAVEIRPWP